MAFCLYFFDNSYTISDVKLRK